MSTAADVYAMGAVLYELLTGRPPFRAATVLDTVLEVIQKEPPHPRTLNPGADPDFSEVALKCLTKSPEGRYCSAAECTDDLDPWLAGEPTRARPARPAAAAWRWLRRNAATAAAVAALRVAWSLSSTLWLFAVADNEGSILLPPHSSPLNPVRWIDAARESPFIRASAILAGATLTLGIGWFVRLAARPRTTRVAIGAAATVALVATLGAF